MFYVCKKHEAICVWYAYMYNHTISSIIHQRVWHCTVYIWYKVYSLCTVRAPIFGTLNSAISNFKTWFVRTVMEIYSNPPIHVLKYCWMYETSNIQCNYNSFIQIINFMAFSVMLWGAEKLVPAEYWCPYGR